MTIKFLSAILISQLLFGLFIVSDFNKLTNDNFLATFLHNKRNMLVEDTAPPDTGTPSDTSAPSGVTNPENTISPPNENTNAQVDTSAQTDLSLPDTSLNEQQSVQGGANSNSQLQEQTQTPEAVQNVVGTEQDQAAAAPQEIILPEETAKLSEGDIITNPADISEEVATQSQDENAQVSQAATPEEEAQMLISFADNNIDTVDSLVQNQDLASADFVLQRINDQIDQSLNDIGGLSENNPVLKEQLISLAQKAEPVLRVDELTVPESLEQDMEIVRGKFLNIEQIK